MKSCERFTATPECDENRGSRDASTLILSSIGGDDNAFNYAKLPSIRFEFSALPGRD
jgi:hypothetical protein